MDHRFLLLKTLTERNPDYVCHIIMFITIRIEKLPIETLAIIKDQLKWSCNLRIVQTLDHDTFAPGEHLNICDNGDIISNPHKRVLNSLTRQIRRMF